MQVLVSGGAGYIGSHMARMLAAGGQTPVVIDTLEYGHQQALPHQAVLIKGNIDDTALLTRVFAQQQITAVIHFAGYISVEESVRDPRRYFQNNLLASISLLETMAQFEVKKIIFSSTAAVYGNPRQVPIPEEHPKDPLNPYGLSKWCFEKLLGVYERQKGIRSISLRYFNASGAALAGDHGEAHEPETHIIPLAISAALGVQKEFHLFGADYPTRDGSCIRDYIHIEDLCQAHLLALEALDSGHRSDVYNVGTGQGVSNKEVIATVKKAAGKDFPVIVKPRRPGDASELVADPAKLKKELGWSPKHSEINEIVATAWKWHSRHPHGYAAGH